MGRRKISESEAHHVPLPSPTDLKRIQDVLRTIGGPNVSWGASQMLDVFVIEHRGREPFECRARQGESCLLG